MAQGVIKAQEPSEDPENYLTHWGLMQVMAGLTRPITAQNQPATLIDTVTFGTDSLRDCAATLTPYYSGKLGIWPQGHPENLAELRALIQ